MRTTGIDKSLYMITLVDDYSRMTLVRGLVQKSNTGKELLAMIAIMERKGEAKVEMIQTDNGEEYRPTELLEELKKKGITIKQTVPYHSQTNPVAERTNGMIITMARIALLQNSNNNAIPRYLWTEAIQHSAYTKNRTPHRTLGGKSPIEIFNNKVSATILEERKAFRAFGEPVYVHQPQEKDKLVPRSEKAIIVGYTASLKTYRVYTESKRLIVTRDPKHRNIYQLNNMSNIRETLSIEEQPNTIMIEQNNNIDNEDNYSPNRNNGTDTSNYTEKNNNKQNNTLEDEQYQAKSIPNLPGSFEEKPRSNRERRPPARYRDEQAMITFESTPSIDEALNGPNSED
jgi:hypothetical protein